MIRNMIECEILSESSTLDIYGQEISVLTPRGTGEFSIFKNAEIELNNPDYKKYEFIAITKERDLEERFVIKCGDVSYKITAANKDSKRYVQLLLEKINK